MLWSFDTTHLTRAGVAATVIEGLVSRKWLAEVVSVEETSVQVQAAFCQAPEAEGTWTRSAPAWTAPSTRPATTRPGRSCWPSATTHRQMTSGSTREFMALCAIHQHFGRPGTPTDQAWTWVAVRPRQGRVATSDQDR
jgi:hypothetical protein